MLCKSQPIFWSGIFSFFFFLSNVSTVARESIWRIMITFNMYNVYYIKEFKALINISIGYLLLICIGKIWDKPKNVCRNYKAFIANIY